MTGDELERVVRDPPRGYLSEGNGLHGVQAVIEQAAWAFGEEVDDLIGPDRNAQLVRYRHCAMAAARSITGASFPAIAKAFNRDHSTVIHAVRKMQDDPLLQAFLSTGNAQDGVDLSTKNGGRASAETPPGRGRSLVEGSDDG